MLSTAAASAAVPSIPASVLGCAAQSTSRRTIKRHRNDCRAVAGNLGHFVQVVKKDVHYLKKNIGAGINWTSGVLGFPEISKKVDEFVWLRNLEDPHYSAEVQSPSWPEPYYPELSGPDLLLADLKALEAYIIYYYHLSKMWSKPLPEVYNAQEADDYFKCRPHIVALRLIEVFGSFASAAIRIRMAGILRSKNSSASTEADEYNSQYTFGMVLKETMLNLGPTFIKVGQSLSTRPDVIGFQISKALSELHDQIPPFPRSLAMKIIEEDLGSPVETFFNNISEEAIAAASFGQVYRASTVDGVDVAVKVQRPNLRHVVFRDIYIMRVGLDILQQVTKRKSDLRLYADELGKGLVGELDYTLEAANAAEFREAHSPFSFIRVPKVFDHLTRKRVLTMEWMAGESPKELLSICSSNFEHESQYSEKQRIDAKRHLLDLVNKGVEACLVQLIETGLLHADPHPGNMIYLPSGQIGFLDFGLICRMEKKHKFAMLASIIHIVNADWASLVGSLAEMDVVRPGTNISRVTMEMEYAMDEIEFKDGIPDVRFSRLSSIDSGEQPATRIAGFFSSLFGGSTSRDTQETTFQQYILHPPIMTSVATYSIPPPVTTNIEIPTNDEFASSIFVEPIITDLPSHTTTPQIGDMGTSMNDAFQTPEVNVGQIPIEDQFGRGMREKRPGLADLSPYVKQGTTTVIPKRREPTKKDLEEEKKKRKKELEEEKKKRKNEKHAYSKRKVKPTDESHVVKLY